MIDKHHCHLAAVTRVDYSGAVDQTKAVPVRQATSRTQQSSEPRRYRHDDTSGDQGALPRRQAERFTRPQIPTCIVVVSPMRNWQFIVEHHELHGQRLTSTSCPRGRQAGPPFARSAMAWAMYSGVPKEVKCSMGT